MVVKDLVGLDQDVKDRGGRVYLGAGETLGITCQGRGREREKEGG